MFETHGNQRYVFASPRLKENISASYLLTLFKLWVRSTSQHERIPIPDASVSLGKVIVAIDSEKDVHSLVDAVTRKILETAPGADVTGVFAPMIPVYVAKENLENVHTISAHHALIRPPTLARFCSTPSLELGRGTLLPTTPPRVDFPSGEAYSLPGIVA